jgi:hypothetical protein
VHINSPSRSLERVAFSWNSTLSACPLILRDSIFLAAAAQTRRWSLIFLFSRSFTFFPLGLPLFRPATASARPAAVSQPSRRSPRAVVLTPVHSSLSLFIFHSFHLYPHFSLGLTSPWRTLTHRSRHTNYTMVTENRHRNQHSHWSGGLRQSHSLFGKDVFMPKDSIYSSHVSPKRLLVWIENKQSSELFRWEVEYLLAGVTDDFHA